MAKACGATRIKIHGDLNLIVQQVMKECDATCGNMMYNKLEGSFECYKVTHIGRGSNEEADSLANIGSKCLSIPLGVFFEEIFERSIKIKSATSDLELGTRPGDEHAKDSAVVEKGASVEHAAQVMLAEPLWTKPYLAYMLHG
jgi:hypothetical protein